MRWRSAAVLLLVLSLLGSLMALAVPPPAAGAQEWPPPSGPTSQHEWPLDCIGRALGVEQYEANRMNFAVTAPSNVAPGELFTIRVTHLGSAFPNTNAAPPPFNEVPVHFLQNINLMFDLPTNASVQNLAVVPGTGSGVQGPFQLSVDSSFSPARIVLFTPLVPKNPTPPTLETLFTFPAFDITLQATGDEGSLVLTRAAGSNRATSGYVFQASSIAMADVSCWPPGQVQGPVLSTTVVGSSATTIETTTQLSASPTILPSGYQSTLRATVSAAAGAPSGVVRFNDGTKVLGFAEVDTADGVASLSATFDVLGDRQVTAHYLGAPGYDPSSSGPTGVTVTNPADRTRAQANVAAANVALPNPYWTGIPPATPTTSVTGSVLATGVGPTPTGTVRIYDNDELVSTQQLVEGAIAPVPRPGPALGGHRLRIEYEGDVNYFPVSGTGQMSSTWAGAAGQNLATSGSLAFNAAGTSPISTQYNGAFRTDEAGNVQLDGTLAGPTLNLTVPGGTISGQLLQAGPAAGLITPNPGNVASLSTRLWFRVTGADLGSGPQSFASTCSVGPWDAELTGTRAGPSGAVTLSQSNFFVPPAPSGSCVTADGTSLASSISARLSGGMTQLSTTFTAPGAAQPVTVSAVSASTPWSFYEQPVTLSATITTPGPTNFPASTGAVEFYSGGRLLGRANATGGTGTQKTASITRPAVSIFDPTEGIPLPLGANELWARYVPGGVAATRAVFRYATGPQGTYQVYELPAKQPVGLTVEVSDDAPEVGEIIEVTTTIDPAPNTTSSPAPLTGTLSYIADYHGGGSEQLTTSQVTPATGATVTVAVSAGPYSLRVLFTPATPSANWWWDVGESNVIDLGIPPGERVPAPLGIYLESTQGTGKVRQGTGLWVTPMTDPDTNAPYGASVPFEFWDGDTLIGGDPFFGQAESTPYPYLIALAPALPTSELGLHTITIRYPSPRNQRYLPSELEFTYEVVPADTSPMPTATRLTWISPAGTNGLPGPALQGATWGRIDGYVSFNAPGTVQYLARRAGTEEVTPLGSAVTVGSSGDSVAGGRGRAPKTAGLTVTGTLPAGLYEVWGEYTSSNPDVWPNATSAGQPYMQRVVAAGSPVATTTGLSVEPAGATPEGVPVTLSAQVQPSDATGTVAFFDGAEQIGTAPVSSGSATWSVPDLALGSHALTAQFSSANPTFFQSSTSLGVTHEVTHAGVETTTTLTASPEGTAYEGDPVTLSATVEPSGAVGSVLFEDEHGDLGTAPVVDGVAALEVDDLTLGGHAIVARFQPADPGAFAPSGSAILDYEIDERPPGPIETGTTLAISPEGSATIGSDVTLTVTVTPTAATGTITILDGDSAIAGPVPVEGGQAQVVVDQLGLGDHSLIAAFTPADPEAYEGSASPAQSYEITAPDPENPPVMTCAGADEVSIGLLELYLADTGGTVTVPTPVISTVPDELSTGSGGAVGFQWSVTLPEDLAALPVELQTHMRLINMDLAIEASGGSSQSWAFPAEIPTIEDTFAPIVLDASGTVTASADADILYRVKSPSLITVSVEESPLGLPQVDVNLTCDFVNNVVDLTEVHDSGEPTAPGAPTNVQATAGPL